MWEVLLYVGEELVKDIELPFVPFKGLNISFGDDEGLYIDKVGYLFDKKRFHCYCEVI